MDEFNTTINKIPPYLTSIYNKIAAKGGAVPAQKNLHNVAAAVQSIPQGWTPPTAWGTLYTTTRPQGYPLASEEDYKLLGVLKTVEHTISFSFGDVVSTTITGYEFGYAPTYIPTAFFAWMKNFTYLSEIPSNIASIGNYFLNNTVSFTQGITVPGSVRSIGDAFMYSCSGVNGQVILQEGVKEIGANFLFGASNITGVSIPSTVTAIGNYFVYNTTNFTGPLIAGCPSSAFTTSPNLRHGLESESASAPMYVQGIKVQGNYAAEWKTAFPNSSSYPYRKLILG